MEGGLEFAVGGDLGEGCATILARVERSLSFAVPCNSSQVHVTSLAVNGLPSCHLTPGCNLR